MIVDTGLKLVCINNGQQYLSNHNSNDRVGETRTISHPFAAKSRSVNIRLFAMVWSASQFILRTTVGRAEGGTHRRQQTYGWLFKTAKVFGIVHKHRHVGVYQLAGTDFDNFVRHFGPKYRSR